jgi:putative peptidoglycan lipid II flippase
MSQKFTSTIAGASIFISLVGLLSRGLGFIREMVFASNFGLETDFDLYLVGAVLPTTINSVILYIGQNYFVPGFQKIKSEDPEAAKKYFNQSFILFIGSGIIIAILLFFLSDLIINNYMQESSVKNKEIAEIIFRIFLFTIPFSAGISILSALLQSVYEFKYPPISILYLNISIILLIFAFSDKIGIYVIPVGYLAGTFLQFLYLQYKSKKYFKLNLKPHRQQFQFLKTMLSPTLLIILLIEAIGQLYSIFDRYFYSQISPGGIASLNYAYIIFILPISIFSISLATAIFPKITQAIVDSEKKDLERIFNESISINILIFMPFTFLLFYFGEVVIKIAFERGKFIGESTVITYNALKYYSISLVFYSVYAVLNKIFYSLNLAKLLLLITILGISLKLLLNFLFVEKYEQNGLALSTSISFIFFFASSYLVLNKKLNISDKNIFIKEYFLYFINCCICFLIIYILMNSLLNSTILIEVMMIGIFIVLYSLNLILVKHKSVLLLSNVMRNIGTSRIIKSI